MEDKIWINKKVYIKLAKLNRAYSGIVIAEDESSITIIDIYGHQVFLNKFEISLIQEER